jgi:hypothetical protein
MANSYVQYNGNGVNYAVPFQYLSINDVSVTVNGTKVPFSWSSPNLVTLASDPGTGLVTIRRTTPNTTAVVDFSDASVLDSSDLDTLSQQFLFLSQEAQDVAALAIQPSADGQWDAGSRRIENVTDPVADQDVVTKKWAQTAQAAQLAQATAQASAAAGSATAAAGSATAAKASQDAAAGSQAAAKTSEGNAAGSASAAAGSASTATQQANASSQSAAASAGSANVANDHANDAAGFATAAAGSAASASTSAGQAAGSATTAGQKADAASTSASNAAKSETNASNSAAAAAQSAAQAAAGGYSKQETDTLLNAKANTTDVNTALASKANESELAAFAKSSDLAPFAKTTDVNASLSDKLSLSQGGQVSGRMQSVNNLGTIESVTSTDQSSFQIRSKDGDATYAFMEFINVNRFGCYFGLDWDNQLRVGGGSMGAHAYRVWTEANLNPIQGVRLTNAGDYAANDPTLLNFIHEPFPGAVVTGVAGATDGFGVPVVFQIRWRYLQVQDLNGNWVTVAYNG